MPSQRRAGGGSSGRSSSGGSTSQRSLSKEYSSSSSGSTSQRSLSETYGTSQGTYQAGSPESKSINTTKSSSSSSSAAVQEGTASISVKQVGGVNPQPQTLSPTITPLKNQLYISSKFQRKAEKEGIDVSDRKVLGISQQTEKREPPKRNKEKQDFTDLVGEIGIEAQKATIRENKKGIAKVISPIVYAGYFTKQRESEIAEVTTKKILPDATIKAIGDTTENAVKIIASTADPNYYRQAYEIGKRNAAAYQRGDISLSQAIIPRFKGSNVVVNKSVISFSKQAEIKGQISGGAVEGPIKDIRDKPLTYATYAGAGYAVQTVIVPAVQIGAGKAFLSVAPKLTSGQISAALTAGKVVKYTAEAGLVGAFAYGTYSEAAAQPTYRESGQVVGINVAKAGAFVAGGYLGTRAPFFKGLQREAARVNLQIDTLGNRELFQAVKDVTIVEKTTFGREFQETDLTYDTTKIQGVNYKQAARLNQLVADQRNVIFGSSARATYSTPTFYQTGTIQQTPYGLIGSPKVPHDIDIAVPLGSVSNVQYQIKRIAPGIGADVKSFARLKSNPWSLEKIKVSVAGTTGTTKITSATEESGRLLQGITNLRPDQTGVNYAYRAPKDIPSFIQLNKPRLTSSDTKALAALGRLEQLQFSSPGSQLAVGIDKAPASFKVLNYATRAAAGEFYGGSSFSGLSNFFIGGAAATKIPGSSSEPSAVSPSVPSSILNPSPSSSIAPFSSLDKSFIPSPSNLASSIPSPSKVNLPSSSIRKGSSLPSPSSFISPSPSPSTYPSPPSPSPSTYPSPSPSSKSPYYYQYPSIYRSAYSRSPSSFFSQSTLSSYASIVPPQFPGGGGFSFKPRARKPKRPFKYEPSLEALEYDIKLPRGIKAEKIRLTGLETRGLII